MAKFKVGDVVSVKREAAEMIDNPALARKRGRVTKVMPGGYYEVDGELGATGLELMDEELTIANSRACNSVRSRNAVVDKALNACARNVDVCNADVVPPDLWEKLRSTSLAYVVTGSLHKGVSVDELIRRFRTSGPGSQIPGRTQDSAIAVSVLEEMKRRGINACGTARTACNATEDDVRKALAEINKLKSLISPVARQIEGLGRKVREITHYRSGLDYKVSASVEGAYRELTKLLWDAANNS
jgi:hypothetical protein